MPAARFATALRQAGVHDVLDDDTSRAAYSSDASLYRVRPLVVIRPHDDEEVRVAMEVCRAEGVPITARGGGTSVAGNAIGTGAVIDFSRHMTRIRAIDAEQRTAIVEPGVVQSSLQHAAAAVGLRFGPDPSTMTRCTIGGMIGNNACGSRTLGYGRTVDNVRGLRGYFGNGEPMLLTAEATSGTGSSTAADLRKIASAYLATIRTEFGSFGRQVSGYALEHLAPERGLDVRRMLVGSEGSLAVVTEATVQLVRDPAHTILVVLGFADMAAAGDATPHLLGFGPTACEGIDSRIVDVVRRRRGPSAVPDLPGGRAWLFVEIAGDDAGEVAERARHLAGDSGADDTLLVTGAAAMSALWRIRADGAGLSGRSAKGLPAHAGWEDAAVPPQRLGAYLRDFEALMAEFGVDGLPYGHFGDGCIHIRIDWPLDKSGGRTVFRNFLTEAASLVGRYGGSLSGEHGDGRARSELLPQMYSPAALAAFAAVKHACDPGNMLNPGIVVDPRPVDADVRVAEAPILRRHLGFAYRHDGGDFTQAVHRCTGVGKCRADNGAAGGVMCPSYLATREERDSTRGRARVLQEMINGSAVTGGWGSPEVHEALELCLSCKGCTSDCPTGIDMPAFKSEVLYQTYRRKLRPISHYSLGWLPRWARMASSAPRLVNAAMALPGVGRLALAGAGVDHRRTLPQFARQTFRDWFERVHAPNAGHGDPVVLFVDSFTNYFTPEVGQAMVKVLEAAGFQPELSASSTCCALTWITTGQLDAAKRILGRTVDSLTAAADRGTPIVGMEPSCTAVLRSDALELIGSRAEAVAGGTTTLAELLTARGWTPPSLRGTVVVAQPHCHHHAVMTWDADAALLAGADADVHRLGGCCGLAGNFGVEKGHYDVSVAVAEQQLLPALRNAAPNTVALADGYSCRTQLADLAHVEGRHLAQLLAEHLPKGG
ncbi:FAD-binding and (Fe-S)-binding domain-containing protein [Mycobacteroides immunogenum]|uniref:Oxidoreductase n=1 Tax=Mycobacteroides immunogenum TaxID=83262 RepID=A0A7V8LMP7_9MYCO|nr:FAD-binding and (Fe-S)-binding domain-containing protein [Mycobacteroides immunogenum]AMT72446.1 oxidoreductase [Mycobacteroides immunogenum]ANO05603.1 oxidoreductase [Mycobacteroides immunogenum]KIU41491.1 oxidoreductase [Mycobacteroides immunogenum]KPG06507.1 oxidoreductase [Mycobacteroides immunogenum]KPG08292.1 oxidoreductase [Mycobacteroides immunogenum]